MDAGFEIMPIDHSSARAEHVSIVPTDMAVPQEVDALIDVLTRRLDDIAFVWAAPPCGTARKARERPIPNCNNAPQPLRSLDQPDGLPGLGGLDKAKTELANQSYEGLCRVLSFLHAHRIPFTLAVFTQLCLVHVPTQHTGPSTRQLPVREATDLLVQ